MCVDPPRCPSEGTVPRTGTVCRSELGGKGRVAVAVVAARPHGHLAMVVDDASATKLRRLKTAHVLRTLPQDGHSARKGIEKYPSSPEPNERAHVTL
jgi:hypothetical protein